MATETSAKLSRLPDGLEFPDKFRGRIAYDSLQHRLVFRGFMTKGDYDRLRGLSQDAEYLRALDQLFQQSASQNGPISPPVLPWIVVVIALLGAAMLWFWLSRR